MTLKFKVKSDQPLDPNFAAVLAELFQAYEDGRYPFDVEQVQNSLSDCMRWAAKEVVYKAMHEKYGDEKVAKAGGLAWTSRWYLEAQKIKLAIPHFCEEPTVAIKRLLEDGGHITIVNPANPNHIPHFEGGA
jgi:hypothetical protein